MPVFWSFKIPKNQFQVILCEDMKHLLITGVPGVGKTTLVNKIITHLNNLQIEFDGFLTEEIRNERFQRTGFSVRLIKTNATTILADKRNHSVDQTVRKLGQYTVYVKSFEDSTLNLLNNFKKGVLIIDEIGKMELFSKKFEDAVASLFKNSSVQILATVPVKGPYFVETLKKNPNCQLFTVTPQNRNQIVDDILKHLV